MESFTGNGLPETSSIFKAVMNVLYHILEVGQNVKSFSNLVASPPGISGGLVVGKEGWKQVT